MRLGAARQRCENISAPSSQRLDRCRCRTRCSPRRLERGGNCISRASDGFLRTLLLCSKRRGRALFPLSLASSRFNNGSEHSSRGSILGPDRSGHPGAGRGALDASRSLATRRLTPHTGPQPGQDEPLIEELVDGIKPVLISHHPLMTSVLYGRFPFLSHPCHRSSADLNDTCTHSYVVVKGLSAAFEAQEWLYNRQLKEKHEIISAVRRPPF